MFHVVQDLKHDNGTVLLMVNNCNMINMLQQVYAEMWSIWKENLVNGQLAVRKKLHNIRKLN